MEAAQGGYYTEGRMIRPLVRGDASLVIYADGAVTIGAWGSDVTMTPLVAAVRQNLFPLVVDGTPSAPRVDTHLAGVGRHLSLRGRAARLGVTSGGPAWASPRTAPWSTWSARLLSPLQLADLLVRAGAVRGMQLDINPSWPVFASFKPAAPDGLAAPSNGVQAHRHLPRPGHVLRPHLRP